MRALKLAASTLVLCAAAVRAQQAPPFWLVARADTVFLYLSSTPAYGFVVYRSAAGAARQPRTTAPVVRVREPAVAAGLLGSDRAMVMRAVRAVNDGEMYRRLQSDRFAAAVLSAVSRPVALVLGRVFVDTGVTRAAEYEYRVVFTDRSGQETDSALTARVRVVDVPPATPAGLRARPGDEETRLTWTFPAYRGDPRDLVVGFHVYRAEGAGQFRRLTDAPVIRDDANPPDFRDTDVRNGGVYRYQVSAVDMVGRESAPSAAVSTTMRDQRPPAMPGDIVVIEGTSVVSLSWGLAPEPDAAGYHVERAGALGDRFTRLNRTLIPPGRPEWVDSVPGGRRYFYRVLVVDAAGNTSDPSNPVSAVPKDGTAPEAPTNVTAAAVARRVTVRWQPVRAPDLRGYYVYRGDAPDRLVRLTSAPVTGTVFVDSGYAARGLRPGGKYLIEVSAVDSSFNESPRTRGQIAIADDAAPAAPTGLEAENSAGRWVDVSWSASFSLDVAAFELSRVSGTAAPVVLGRFDARARGARDTAVTHGQAYVYRLVAIDSIGNRSVPAVDTVQFRDVTPPPAPMAVGAKASTDGVTVTWLRVVASELAGYHVYRSALPTGEFTRLTTAPLTALTYLDRAGKPGLFYVVRAVDRSGNESRKSDVAGVVP